MPIYSTEEMKKLYSMIEKTVNIEDREVLHTMMEKFNGIVRTAVRQHEYIKTHEKQYADNMNENHKLKEEKKRLEDKINRLQIVKKCMQEEMRELKQILRKLNIKY